MTKDFLLGLAWGLLLALFLIWLFDRKPEGTPPKDSAQQGVPETNELELVRKKA